MPVCHNLLSHGSTANPAPTVITVKRTVAERASACTHATLSASAQAHIRILPSLCLTLRGMGSHFAWTTSTGDHVDKCGVETRLFCNHGRLFRESTEIRTRPPGDPDRAIEQSRAIEHEKPMSAVGQEGAGLEGHCGWLLEGGAGSPPPPLRV